MMRRYKVVLLTAVLIASVALWLAYSAAGVPILAYHKVSEDDEIYSVKPAEFEKQMRYLSDHGYTAISLTEMLEAFAGKRDMPAKPVIITFDDGYEDNYLAALPIMEKYRMKATVFVIAGKVGEPGYLKWQQIRAMQERNTEIGSHTLSHAALSEITPEEQQLEIAESKAVLERNLGTPVEYLAYPYGKFTASLFAVLQGAGYRAACSGITGLNLRETDPFVLRRINIPQPRYGLMEFRARLLRADIYYRLSR